MTTSPLAQARISPWLGYSATDEAAFQRMYARCARDRWDASVAAHRAAKDGTAESARLSMIADTALYAAGFIASPFAVGLPRDGR